MARAVMTLASWRVRRTWGLLLVMGVGMVAGVMLVCVVPLYSQVAMTAGLRQALTASYANSDMFVQSSAEIISSSVLSSASQQIDREFKRHLGGYVGSQAFSIETGSYLRLLPQKSAEAHTNSAFQETFDQVRFIGASIDQVGSRFTVVQGSLPADDGGSANNHNAIDVAISTYSASMLHAHLGEIIYVSIPLKPLVIHYPLRTVATVLALHIVGVFNLAVSDDPYFHGQDFVSVRLEPGEMYPVLVSNKAFIALFSALTASQQQALTEPITCSWFYHFDAAHIGINDLKPILHGTNAVLADTSKNFILDSGLYIEHTQVGLATDTFQQYDNRAAVAQLALFCFLCLIFGLVLFFVSMMMEWLVDLQLDAIALLCSRGASRRQIAAMFIAQSLGLSLLALLAGPLLAGSLAHTLVLHMLPPTAQGALDVLPSHPLQLALMTGWYALAAAVVAFAALVIAVFRATRLDVLSLRRESSRPTRRVFWQRLNFDGMLVVAMLACYGISLYLTRIGLSDARLRLLFLSPLTLMGTVCLLLAALLLSLRLFPRLLQQGAALAARSRAATPLLALAQMARAPHRSIRMMLLLALATALVIFTLIFTASEVQRVPDVAAYQSGADFSGAFNDITTSPARLRALYRAIPGVASATLGYSSTLYAGNGSTLPVEFRAVDASTFAQTGIWTAQDSSQSLHELMQQLQEQRAFARTHNAVPAIVDAATWDALKLTINANFILVTNIHGGDPLHFVAVAEAQHIPTVSDSAFSTDSNSTLSSGGVLVDYQSYASVYARDYNGRTVPLNYAWLRSYDDAASVASVRMALSNTPLGLQPLYDRRAIISSLNNGPLSLGLSGVLALGATITILLTLFGSLLGTWLSAHSRLMSFAVLRALGCSRRQIASVFTLEQGIIYTTAFGLGILLGAVLARLTLPTLIFTGVSLNGSAPGGDVSSGQFYLLQNVPPVQIIIPPSLAIALAALIGVCVLAIALLVRIVSRPSLGQALRLSED